MVDSYFMLQLTDPRWPKLKSGRRTPFDARPLLRNLESRTETKVVWDQLWDELHHQGDVDECAYACVPHLVRIYVDSGKLDWNTYAIVSVIELARTENSNPEIPEWLESSYQNAIKKLASLGAAQILSARDPETVRGILCVMALEKGLRTHASFLIEYTDDELEDIKGQAGY